MSNWYSGLMRSSTGFWTTVVLAGTAGVAAGTLLATEPAVILSAAATDSQTAPATSSDQQTDAERRTAIDDGFGRGVDGTPRVLTHRTPSADGTEDGGPRPASTHAPVAPPERGTTQRTATPAAGPTAAGGPAVLPRARSWVSPGSPGRAPGAGDGRPGSHGRPLVVSPVVPPIGTVPPVVVPPVVVPPTTEPPVTPPPTDPPTTPPTDPTPTDPGPGDGGGTGSTGTGGSGTGTGGTGQDTTTGGTGQDSTTGDSGQTVSPQSTTQTTTNDAPTT